MSDGTVRPSGLLAHALSKSVLAALCGLLILQACATGETGSGGAGDAARLVFYRLESPFFKDQAPQVLLNDAPVGRMEMASSVERSVAPGSYQATLEGSPREPLRFTVSAGETRYLATVPEFTVEGNRLKLVLVVPEKARSELDELRTGS